MTERLYGYHIDCTLMMQPTTLPYGDYLVFKGVLRCIDESRPEGQKIRQVEYIIPILGPHDSRPACDLPRLLRDFLDAVGVGRFTDALEIPVYVEVDGDRVVTLVNYHDESVEFRLGRYPFAYLSLGWSS